MAAKERLQVVLELVASQYKREAKAAATATGQVATSAMKAGDSVGHMERGFNKLKTVLGAAVIFQAGKQLAAFGKEALDLAVDAEEAASAFATAFGAAEDDMASFVNEFANMAGFTKGELKQLLAVTGSVVQGIGATEEESAQLAKTMTRLAGDVASFTNAEGGAQAVLLALQSAINGEREALKTYGLAINEAEVTQRALNDTNKTAAGDLTRLEKAQATVTLAYEKAGKMIGDLENTQGSSANVLRQLGAAWREAMTDVGTALSPILEDVLPALKNALPGIADEIVEIAEAFAELTPELVALFNAGAGKGDGLSGIFEKQLKDVALWARIIRNADADLKAFVQRNIEFDKAASDLTVEINEMTNALLDGVDPSEALTASLGYLQDQGTLTGDALNTLIEQSGLKGSALIRVLEGVRVAQGAAWGGEIAAAIAEATEEMEGEKDAAYELGLVMRGIKKPIDEVTGSTKESKVAMSEAQIAARNRRVEASKTAEALWSQVTAETTLAEVINNAASPLQNYLGQWDNYLEMLDAASDPSGPGGKAITANEELSLIFQQLQLDANALSPAEYEQAMAAMRIVTGKTREEIEAMLDARARIDGFTATQTILTKYVTDGGPPTNIKPISTPVKNYHGGTLQAGQISQVGEYNKPEMYMIPGDSGRVFSNADVRAMIDGGGSSSGGLVINMTSVDPVVDAQRVGAMAAVKRRMET